MAFVEGSPATGKEILYSREEVMDYYRRATEEARVPFICLSHGVSNATFQYALELAAEAGLIFPECFADGPRGKTALQFLPNTA